MIVRSRMISPKGTYAKIETGAWFIERDIFLTNLRCIVMLSEVFGEPQHDMFTEELVKDILLNLNFAQTG